MAEKDTPPPSRPQRMDDGHQPLIVQDGHQPVTKGYQPNIVHQGAGKPDAGHQTRSAGDPPTPPPTTGSAAMPPPAKPEK